MRTARLVAAAALLTVAAACTSGGGGSSPPGPTGPGPFYVSLGDSYSNGTQPVVGKGDTATTNGYADQLVHLGAGAGKPMTLVNYGCGGANTSSLLHQKGCAAGFRAVGGPQYPKTTQVDAATSFIKAHPGKIALVTVLIGGNSVLKCSGQANFEACVSTAVPGIENDLGQALHQLRAAAGPDTPIVGLTYPNLFLGAWTWQNVSHDRVRPAVPVYQNLFNPALKRQYEAVGAKFVDITAATGGYGSLDETTNLQPYGLVPVPVARACELTFYCQYRDVHARTEGYRIIAQQIAATLTAH